LALASCLAFGLLAAAPAGATFHIMQIREIGGGTSGAGFNDAYVELQMYAPGQNLVAGHTLTFWDHDDITPTSTTTFSANVPNGQNQATILIGDDSLAGTADATNSSLSNLQLGPGAGGGLVCWENIDCVSIGSGPSATVTPPSPTGPAAPFPFTGQAIRRTIARGCPTSLDAADDTNNSAADFSVTTPNPRNNAAPITETLCPGQPGANTQGPPNTKIKRRPKNRSDDHSPTWKFKSTERGSKFKCKLDHKKYRKCKSPKTYHRVKPGKHIFKVEAIDADGNVDPTPAKDKFRILP
jgi:hypothetical protein